MFHVGQTETYMAWFAGLKDRKAKARIDVRIRRLSLGNPGDVKPVGNSVSELRIDYGNGYRIYYTQRGVNSAVLLCGGTKNGQDRDIRQALKLASELED